MTVRIAPKNAKAEKNQISADRYIRESDEGLMGLFQSGDALAFHYLIERHKGLIRVQVRKYFGAGADVEDIMQDICLSLWQNRMSWKPGVAKFSTWLFRVTANRCIDILRQKKEISTDSNFDHITSGIMSAEERMSESQTSVQLMKLLTELPSQQQLALKMFYYEDANIGQICQKMSLSDQAVRSLLKRGKQKLRAVMEPDAMQAALV